MKTAQTEKLERVLRDAEKELRETLLRVLPAAATGGSNLFTNAEFNPSNLPQHRFRSDADGLLKTARQCVQLRKQIGAGVIGSVGYLFLQACEENSSRDEQRRGPRKLAAWLLGELGSGTLQRHQHGRLWRALGNRSRSADEHQSSITISAH
jgi:hypothetical protein